MNLKKIAVVILNWNGKKFLEKFLPSVVQYTFPYAEIIIADNASTDDSISFLEQNYPQIRIIRNDKNYGFAKGYNVALEQVNADYFLLLNSDIEVTPDWIIPLYELMESNPDVAVCQPKLLAYDARGMFEYAGAAGGFIDKYGYPFCRGRIFTSIEKDNGQYDDACEIFWATGAALFVRSELYKQTGGLDDDFFAHMEEIDFCWRIKNMGYKVMYCPQSKVYHVGGGTLPKSSARKTYLNFRNNFVLLYKNLPKNRVLPVFLSRLFLDGAAGIKFLLGGSFQELWAVTRAHFYFYRHFKHIAAKRKKTKQNAEVSCLYNSSIVFDFYFRGIKEFSSLNKKKIS